MTLQVIAQRVAAFQGTLDEARIKKIAATYADGRDEWGHEILVAWRPETEEPSSVGGDFLLVSRGADGKLDDPDIEDYFGLEEAVWVDGEFERDLVFRNQEVLRVGGKRP